MAHECLQRRAGAPQGVRQRALLQVGVMLADDGFNSNCSCAQTIHNNKWFLKYSSMTCFKICIWRCMIVLYFCGVQRPTGQREIGENLAPDQFRDNESPARNLNSIIMWLLNIKRRWQKPMKIGYVPTRNLPLNHVLVVGYFNSYMVQVCFYTFKTWQWIRVIGRFGRVRSESPLQRFDRTSNLRYRLEIPYWPPSKITDLESAQFFGNIRFCFWSFPEIFVQ